VTKAALRKFLNSFRVQAVNVCVNVAPDAVSQEAKRPAGALQVAFAQGKVHVLDAAWGLLEEMYDEKNYEEKEGVAPFPKEANDAGAK
jgi:hypothetical protein